MFGFLKKKKNKADNASSDAPEQEILKPIYKPLTSSSSMVAIICPYCEAELAQLYFMRVDTFDQKICPHCNREMDI